MKSALDWKLVKMDSLNIIDIPQEIKNAITTIYDWNIS